MYDGGPHVIVADADNVMVYNPQDLTATERGALLLCDLATGRLWHPTGEEISAWLPANGTIKSFKVRTPKAKHPRVGAFTTYCAVRGWKFQDVATEVFGCTRARLHQCLSEYKPCPELRARIEALTPEIVHTQPWSVPVNGNYGYGANPSKKLKFPADYRGEAKTCSVCGTLWPCTTEYFSARGENLNAQCRDCQRTYNRVYYGRSYAAGMPDTTTEPK